MNPEEDSQQQGAEGATPPPQVEGQAPDTTQVEPAGGEKGKQGPGPVPYQTFAETNRRFRQAEKERDEALAKLSAADPEEISGLRRELEQTRELAQVKLALARAGVETDGVMDYLVSRYQGLGDKRPELPTFIETLRSQEPAFFNVRAPEHTKEPPPPNPSNGTTPNTTPEVQQPITDAYLENISPKEFRERWPEIQEHMRKRRRG